MVSMVPVPRGGLESANTPSDLDRCTGSDFSSTAFITLNTAVLAPMPSASVKIAVIAKPRAVRQRATRESQIAQQLVQATPGGPAGKSAPAPRGRLPKSRRAFHARFILAHSLVAEGRRLRVQDAPRSLPVKSSALRLRLNMTIPPRPMARYPNPESNPSRASAAAIRRSSPSAARGPSA